MSDQMSLFDERTWAKAPTKDGFDRCICTLDTSIGTDRVSGYYLGGHVDCPELVAHIAYDCPYHPALAAES